MSARSRTASLTTKRRVRSAITKRSRSTRKFHWWNPRQFSRSASSGQLTVMTSPSGLTTAIISTMALIGS
ncbi:hypothetical protein CH337_17310 [Rhodoblastus acidophilus]|nr:hypothetical protein CKO16_21710 [Rhodoblastus acidophilus]RAI17235.1 hypothetical protein CH337_17310 [Rhodoblastus acidophilus]